MRRLVIHQHERLAGESTEINKHIGSFGRSHYQTSGSHWSVPHAAIGSDLPEVRPAEIEIQDPRVGAVQDSEPVHARFDIEIWPYFSVDQHDVAEIFADPNHVFDVARRVKELSVSAELAVLDHERNFVRSAGDADRVGFHSRVKSVTEEIGRGETAEDVEARRAQTMIVEPQKRCWLFVWILDALWVAASEPIGRDRGVAVAIACDKSAV